MSIRYLYNVTLGVGAGFLVLATQVFAATPAMWLVFAIAAGVTAASLGIVAIHGVGMPQRVIAAATTALGAWTVIASLVFVTSTAVTLGFASALAFVGLALIGLTVHEVSTERVVHQLEVNETPAGAVASRNGHGTREPIAA